MSDKPYKPREVTLSRLRNYIDDLFSSGYGKNSENLRELRIILDGEIPIMDKKFMDGCVHAFGDIYTATNQEKNRKDGTFNSELHDIAMQAGHAYSICINWESRSNKTPH